MSCAKKKVQCVIISVDGEAFVGENWCHNPQEVCPRSPGENYDKCHSICKQSGHAEINALKKAKRKAEGATAYLVGHHHYCRACQLAMFSAGIKQLSTPTE